MKHEVCLRCHHLLRDHTRGRRSFCIRCRCPEFIAWWKFWWYLRSPQHH